MILTILHAFTVAVNLATQCACHHLSRLSPLCLLTVKQSPFNSFYCSSPGLGSTGSPSCLCSFYSKAWVRDSGGLCFCGWLSLLTQCLQGSSLCSRLSCVPLCGWVMVLITCSYADARQLPFLTTVSPLSIAMLDAGLFESLLRETDLKRSMMM